MVWHKRPRLPNSEFRFRFRKESYDDIFSSLDGDDSSGSELNLLPGVLEVDDVNTSGVFVVDVSFHVEIEVDGSDVYLTRRRLELL